MFLNRVVKIEDDPRLPDGAISASCPDPAHIVEQLRSLQTVDSFGRAGSLYYARTFALPRSQTREGPVSRDFSGRVLDEQNNTSM
jgi:hypothetical protein